LTAVAQTASRLSELDLRDNPVSGSRQALDVLIVSCEALQMLNGRILTQAERVYLTQLRLRGARSSLSQLSQLSQLR